MPSRTLADTARGLALASHRVPTMMVAAMVTVLAASAGNTVFVCATVAVATLVGQLSIGWSNDAIDAGRDALVHRLDKPIATGLVTRRTVAMAALVAVAVDVPLSLALGWRSGLAQLVVVACGWLYNTVLKSSWFSALPYFVAFGSLPAVAWLALPARIWPPVWVLLAGGLIGAAAHFANVGPDLGEDAVTGISGMPHRLGASVSAWLAAGLALSAVTLVAVGPPGAPTPQGVVGVAVSLVLVGLGRRGVRQAASSRAAFYTTMAVGAIGVALIVSSG